MLNTMKGLPRDQVNDGSSRRFGLASNDPERDPVVSLRQRQP